MDVAWAAIAATIMVCALSWSEVENAKIEAQAKAVACQTVKR